jgi:hypothetical protein
MNITMGEGSLIIDGKSLTEIEIGDENVARMKLERLGNIQIDRAEWTPAKQLRYLVQPQYLAVRHVAVLARHPRVRDRLRFEIRLFSHLF